jgi:two-component system nitrogen regulation sensor histidine kinase NtrY
LAGVTAGVIGVNKDDKVTLANSAAGELFETSSQDLIGQQITELIPDISPLLEKAYGKPNKIAQSEVPYVTAEGRKLTLMMRIAIELIGAEDHGAVLTFDDITELQSAQRKAAWADVARRIAHEIKNPLTPIQLSAERLRRKYLDEISSDPETFKVCTDTIIRHVEDIGRMVSEFSDFARMPESIMRPTKLIAELQDLVTFQKATQKDIEISLNDKAFEYRDLVISCDGQQIRQALTNLLQNAIESLQAKLLQETAINMEQGREPSKENHFKPKLSVFIALKGGLTIVVSDNGLGLPEGKDPATLSEPYVTHRDKGTGLGLAIVKKIMSDHGGELIIGVNDKVRQLEGFEDLGGATIALTFPLNEMVQIEETKAA